jgi:hypothetical protein
MDAADGFVPCADGAARRAARADRRKPHRAAETLPPPAAGLFGYLATTWCG